ncbi:MAG: magnesium transporter [Rickettsiales bacterium]|nr:magnesium transporter [Rickettsiales bacterium]
MIEQTKDYYSEEDILLPMLSALKDDDLEALRSMLSENHPTEIAELLNLCEPEDREKIIAVLGDIDPEILTFLDDSVRDDILKIIGSQSVAEAIEELESDDAVQLVQDLPEEQIEEILEGLSLEKRQEVEESLNYPEESAGRLANKQFVTISDFASVGDTIDLMRTSENLPQDFYTIFVVDEEGRPTHYIPLSRIMRNKREVKVRDLMQEIIKIIPVDTDQEEVANIFQKYGLISAPVVNHNGKMVGVITVDDITYIIKQEAEEDILGMVGLTSQKDLFGSVIKRFSSRSPWLFINLITAFVTSFIISFFEKSIAELVALATLMPIVASMSGNCGTQTLTITVRALATKELSSNNFFKMLKREFLTSMLISLALGSSVFLVSFLMYENYLLSSIIFSAIILTFFLASISGCAIPFIMQKLRFDPAVASSVLLTAITDMSSFFIFLTLATKIILH